MGIQFTRATRSIVALKIGIIGPSGSGKTTAALRLARGLVGPEAQIAVCDTENGSASLYSDITPFDVVNMTAPYLPGKFIDVIDAAVQAKYQALIIDSGSHEWIQILQDKEAMDARGGNQWTNWAGFTKKHEEFLAKIRNAPIHLIICLRAKEKHEMTDAKKIVKMGVGSQMRDGFEYELTTVFDLGMDHSAKASKDRTRLFDGRTEQVTEQTGRELAAWLTQGKPLSENSGEKFEEATKVSTPEPAPEPPSAEDPAFVAAIVDLGQAMMGQKTREKTIQAFLDRGPSSLPDVLAKIEEVKAKLPGAAFTDMTPPAPEQIPQEAASFVDGVSPDTDTANGGITDDQYAALNALIEAHGINRNALRAYCAKSGKLLESKNGPTLARMKEADFTKLRDKLNDTRIAAKGETWAQRTVKVINETPITNYQPTTAA